MPEHPTKRFQAQQISLVTDECLQALLWRQRSGWPGHHEDLRLSAELYREAVDQHGEHWRAVYWPLLCELLLVRYGAGTAAYRAMLCLLVTDVRDREQGGREPRQNSAESNEVSWPCQVLIARRREYAPPAH